MFQENFFKKIASSHPLKPIVLQNDLIAAKQRNNL